MVRDELFTSQSELQGSREELRVARDELRNKTALLDGARHEASEAVSSVERLTEECHGLRGDLHRQKTLVVQRDEVIGRLRDEACTQWASGWLAFQRKVANAYLGLDLTSTFLATRRRKSPSPQIILENQILPLRPTPLLHPLLLPLMSDLPHIPSLSFLSFFFFFLGLGPRTYISFFLMNIHFLFHHFRLYLCSSCCFV